jgi:hypothetical protein
MRNFGYVSLCIKIFQLSLSLVLNLNRKTQNQTRYKIQKYKHAIINKLRGFLGAFIKLRKATISSIFSVRMSRMEQLDSHWMDFHEI